MSRLCSRARSIEPGLHSLREGSVVSERRGVNFLRRRWQLLMTVCSSVPASIEELNILFLCVADKPKIVRIEPPPPLTFDMREQIRLTCVTEGNPTPKISWLQQNGNGDQKVWNMRGRESTLVVNNATYEYQGVYICEAANEIKGKLYRVQSQEARVDIKGKFVDVSP